MKKNIINKILFVFIAIFSFIACENRELITVDNQSAPIMLDISAEKLVLDRNFPSNPGLTLSWDVATYTVPTEIKYKIEVSKDEAFTAPYTLGTVAGSVRATTFSVEQMNQAAQGINLEPNVSAKMYIRVSSYLGTVSENLVAKSNVTSLMITPYVLEYPDFYLVGGATYVGWTAENAQILHKKDNLSYIYTYLENNQPFRFLGQQSWNPINYSVDKEGTRANYRYFKQLSGNLLQDGDENMKFTGDTGIYKIEIDATKNIQSLNITASPVLGYDFPEVYLVGTINGWDAANAIAMTKVSSGKFEYTVKLDNGAAFKFLGQKDWKELEWGNISGSGNSGFLGPKGDSGDIKFDGGGNTYKITVDIKAGVYTIVQQ